MSTHNVVPLLGARLPTGVPNEALVKALEGLLEHARSGRLQSFIGTGFGDDGKSRFAHWSDSHDDVYQMLGALAWLQHEYVARHSDQQ